MDGANTTASVLVAGQESVNVIKTPPMATLNVNDPHRFGAGSGIPIQLETISGSVVLPSPFREETESLPKDAPLPAGNTAGSAEGSLQYNELIEICTKLIVSKDIYSRVRSHQN